MANKQGNENPVENPSNIPTQVIPRISRLALWSLVIGIFVFIIWISLCMGFAESIPEYAIVFIIAILPVLGLLGIIIGRRSFSHIKKGQDGLINYCFAIAGVAINIIGVCYFLISLVPYDIFEDQSRSQVSRAKSDMRSISTALESYYIDYNRYPESCSDSSSNLYAYLGGKSRMASQPTFGLTSAQFHSITTPVAFMASIPSDPFARVKGAPYCYYADPSGTGWILWSAGPDRKYDLTAENIGSVYKPVKLDITHSHAYTFELMAGPELLSLTYDPTNGTKSAGDVWRIKS